MRASLSRFLLAFPAALLLGLSGCTTSATPVATSVPPRSIAVQLAWVHSIEYAGFYMAQDKGDYAAEGLDVSLKTLGDTAPIDAVLAGDAAIGVTSADLLLLARAAGKPVVAIATIYQRSPVAFISLAEQQITTPQDLVGKNVLVDLNGTTAIVYRALLASQGIEEQQINTIPRTDYTNEALLSGGADVMDAFINNQPVQLARQGHAVNSILASDYGIDLYANVLFTTETIIAEQPELIEGFVRGTVRGLQRAIDNGDEATQLAVARDPTLDRTTEAEALRLALPLLKPGGSKPGLMTAEAWSQTGEMLVSQGLLTSAEDIDAAYTLQFLEHAYDGAQSGSGAEQL